MNAILVVTSALQLVASDPHSRRIAPPSPPAAQAAPEATAAPAKCRRREFFRDLLKPAGEVIEVRLSDDATNFVRGVYAQIPPAEPLSVTEGAAYLSYVEGRGGIVAFYGADDCAKTTMVLRPDRIGMVLTYRGARGGDRAPSDESKREVAPGSSPVSQSREGPDWY